MPGLGRNPSNKTGAAMGTSSQGMGENGLPRGLVEHFPMKGPLKLSEYQDRLVTSNGTQSVYLSGSGCTVRYAYVTQRGYYPDAPDKANQDSFCVKTNFGGDLEQMFFGVFDGHGENGTPCSQFSMQKLPENVVRDSNFDMHPEIAYHNAFVTTNQELHANDEIDDTMSGTTGITTLLRGRYLYTANVGDSRAFIAERQGQQLVAVDLSSDQTPFRRDECARVKQCGARVLTLDQLEGIKDPNVECWGTEEEDDGDPPRLWAHNGMYPGTAFTRSLGDSAAERIGVTAEPEVSIRHLEHNVEFLVVASDGVFEFMKSQVVADMISKYDDPHEAALAVCAEAYNLWLQFETRTDDITCIIVFFTGMEDQTSASQQASLTAGDAVDPGTPERNSLTRRQTWGANDAMKHISTAQADGDDSDDEGEYQLPKPPQKSQEEIKMLEDAVKSNFLFSHLNMMQRLLLFQAMLKRNVKPGEVVIKQGERGDHFYVVEEGQFDVLVSKGDDPAELVHTYHAVNGQHPSFGELALMYGKPRAATVVARTSGSLFELNRKAFRTVMTKRDPKIIMKLLQNVEALEPLTTGQMQRLADSLQAVTFEDGEYIIRQGEIGSEFYAIESGEVVCTVSKGKHHTEGDSEREVLRLGQFQYFGERALVCNEARGANVKAKGKTYLLTISRFEFEAMLGSLDRIAEDRQAWVDRGQVSQEMMMQRAGALLRTPFNLSDLQCKGILFTEEVLALASMIVEGVGTCTVRLVSISDTVALGHQAQIVRASNIARNLTTSIFIPPVIKTLRNQAVMADVLLLDDACPLSALADEYNPLPEDSISFLMASIILALEHMHMANILYRGLSAETVLVTKSSDNHLPGYAQLVDLRFAKTNDGRTFTVTGPAEYLAPEVVGGRGATEASDWWACGVLGYWMAVGMTPFARAGDDDLRICRRISEHSIDELTLPSHISSTLADLLRSLMEPDPNMRLGNMAGGVRSIKSHPFFANTDWDSLADGILAPPDSLLGITDVWDSLEPGDVFSPWPYTGDTSWLDAF